MSLNYSSIYLLHEKNFMDLNEKVYKIGKTRQPNIKRFKQYPIGSKLLFYIECYDCDIMEKELILEFNKTFKLYKGNEYFEGDHYEMINIIFNKIKLDNELNKNKFINLNNPKPEINQVSNINLQKPDINKIENKNQPKIHQTHKQYYCEICESKFASYHSQWKHNKNLHSEIHINIVKKNKKFKCEKCDRSFTRKDNLKIHMDNTCKNKDIINDKNESNSNNKIKNESNSNNKIILLEKKINEIVKGLEDLKKNTVIN